MKIAVTDAKRFRILEKYETLELLNRGMHKMKNKTDKTQMGRLNQWHISHAIATQLELKNWEKKAIWHLVDPLDMRAFKKYDRNDAQGVRKDYLVAFCAAILVHNDTQSHDDGRYHPSKKIENQQKWDGLWRPFDDLRDRPVLFQQLREALGFEKETVISCLEKARSEVEQLYHDVGRGELSTTAVEDPDCWSKYINH